MPAGLPIAVLLLAQAAAGPAEPVSPAAAAKPAEKECDPNRPSGNPNEIVICAQHPQGYRLDPDILEARRLKKSGTAGRPTRPGPIAIKDQPCGTVGPAPCMTGGINLIGAAMTAGEIAARLARGEEVGSIFETDPQPTDYQLYQEAKRRREAKEAAAKAKAVQTEAQAKAKAAAATAPAKD
jgi:hypothetical protein